jgi:putative tRNA adenosine deaminase-associated protein
MSQTRLEQVEAVDIALAAFRVDGVWQLGELADSALESMETLVHSLRRFPSEVGSIAMLTVDEDFFIVVRAETHQVRVLLSDVTAAEEWELAESVLEFLGLPMPDPLDDSDDEVGPAGDLTLLADLGMHPVDMGVLLDDVELYPDEMLSDIATRLGFGHEFDEAAGLESL